MNIDKAFTFLVLSVVAIFLLLQILIASFPGDDGIYMSANGVIGVFFFTAFPLCSIGGIISLFLNKRVTFGLFYGLAGSVSLTAIVAIHSLAGFLARL